MVRIGTTFRYTYADSNPEWEVVKKRSRGVWYCEIVKGEWAGAKKVFTTGEINGFRTHDAMIKRVFDRAGDFWNSRKLGEIVHYHNGFGQYVRGRVTKNAKGEKMMMPLALVGKWSKHDLPSRRADGSIHYPFHARRIMEANEASLFNPHDSNMWESMGFAHDLGGRPDPTALPEIDLTVEALDSEAERKAAYERARMEITSMLSEGGGDPIAVLREAKARLNQMAL